MFFKLKSRQKAEEKKEREEFYDEIVENYLSQVLSGELF